MVSKVIETGENPHLIIEECFGDLTVQGVNESRITFNLAGDEESLDLVVAESAVRFTAQENCRILCPVGATLDIQVAHGNLKATGIHGRLTIGEVYGDAQLRDTGPLTVAEVYGNVRLQQVAGDVQVGEVSSDARIGQVTGALNVHAIASDARISDIAGPVAIEQVGSDFKAEGLAQGLTLGGAGSDVRLAPPFTPGAVYQVRAGSDLTIRLPEEANVRFALQAGGGVRSSIPNLELHEAEGSVTGVLGAGEAFIQAQVGGRVRLKGAGGLDEGPDHIEIDLSFLDHLADLGPMIEARVSEAMAELDINLQEGLRHLDGERIRLHIERAAEKAEYAAQRIADRARAAAEREADHARRHAEHEAERARLRAEHAERRWQRASGHRPPTPPAPAAPPMPGAPPAPPAPPASTYTENDKREERLQILRMVEEGKLSPEEAANLLAALR